MASPMLLGSAAAAAAPAAEPVPKEAWKGPLAPGALACKLGLAELPSDYSDGKVSKAWATQMEEQAGEADKRAKKGKGKEEEQVLTPADAEERWKRIKDVDGSCIEVLQQSSGDVATLDEWKRMLLVDNETEVMMLPCIAFSGMPAQPQGTKIGQGMLLLSKIQDPETGSKYRLHFVMMCSRASMEAEETWGEQTKGFCCFTSTSHKVQSDYTSKHTTDMLGSSMDLDGNLFHVHYQVKDEATLISTLGGGPRKRGKCCSGCRCPGPWKVLVLVLVQVLVLVLGLLSQLQLQVQVLVQLMTLVLVLVPALLVSGKGAGFWSLVAGCWLLVLVLVLVAGDRAAELNAQAEDAQEEEEESRARARAAARFGSAGAGAGAGAGSAGAGAGAGPDAEVFWLLGLAALGLETLMLVLLGAGWRLLVACCGKSYVNKSTGGNWSSATSFEDTLDFHTTSIAQEIVREETFKFPNAAPVQHYSERAAVTRKLHTITLKYRCTQTDDMQTCEIVAKPDEKITDIGRLTSWLSSKVSEVPEGLKISKWASAVAVADPKNFCAAAHFWLRQAAAVITQST